MGCSSSTPVHPSIYNETIKKRENGNIKEKAPLQEVNTKYMKGDYSQFQLAKHNREKHQKERQIKLFLAADEMTGKVMEDREMLSLGTRSRGTSRNTSRATSPTSNKRNQQQKEDHVTPMTPVAELSRGTSLKSIDNTPKKKHKSHKQSKNKSKTKKHRKGKKSKKGKGKASQELHDSDSDSGLENEIEGDEEYSDTENVKENEEMEAEIKNTQNAHKTEPISNSSNANNTHETVLPLKETNSANSVETPLISNRSARDIKIQSSSKDSGIAESGINELPNQSLEDTRTYQEDSNLNDAQPKERSDSRI